MDLKVGCEYVRRYRDSLAATTTRFAVIRAVVSVSALGTWAAVKSYPMVWGGIIAAAQVADALQNAIPFAARFRATNALRATFDSLFIAAARHGEASLHGLQRPSRSHTTRYLTSSGLNDG
jgi:hypothetical protein